MTEPDLAASVIIPSYNRLDALRETLEALSRVDFPRDRWEAIVVDDGSTEPAEAEVLGLARRTGLPLRFVSQANSGPARARNRGAAEARGKVLIFIDNDIIVEPGFVQGHLGALAAAPGCWVMGRVKHPPELARTPFGRYLEDYNETLYRWSEKDRPSVLPDGLSAANLSLPAEDFRRFGGFDERFPLASGEDSDLGLRARLGGVRVVYDPRLAVVHNDWAVSLDRFCERHKLYSQADVLYWRLRGSACPRAALVRSHGPVFWGEDSAGVVLKKAVKGLASTQPGTWFVRRACILAEWLAPDTRACRKAYDLAVALAIFRGVRAGWALYGERPAVGDPAVVSCLVTPGGPPDGSRRGRQAAGSFEGDRAACSSP